MPRDIDFNRPRRASTPEPTPLSPGILRHAQQPSRTKNPRIWLIAIIVVVSAVVIIGLIFYFLSLRPSPVSQQAKPTADSSPSVVQALLSGQSEPEVTLYDSGAGAQATDDFAAKIKNLGLTVQSLGVSQLTLDQTYIWYQASFTRDAERLKAALGDKRVSLRPYGGTGPYKILIQLGP